MCANRLKAWLERLMFNPMQDKVKEAIELKEDHESIEQEINNSDMITISELIGFPVPKEHGEELMNRLSIYNKMTKKELMVLLLQHDWELLQLQKNTPISTDVFNVKERIQKSLEAIYSASVIAKIKDDIHPDFLAAVITAVKKREIDGFDAVAIIEKRHREIGTCRGCHHYENNCPFIAGQNKRGEFGYYPNVVCDDYKSREEL